MAGLSPSHAARSLADRRRTANQDGQITVDKPTTPCRRDLLASDYANHAKWVWNLPSPSSGPCLSPHLPQLFAQQSGRKPRPWAIPAKPRHHRPAGRLRHTRRRFQWRDSLVEHWANRTFSFPDDRGIPWPPSGSDANSEFADGRAFHHRAGGDGRNCRSRLVLPYLPVLAAFSKSAAARPTSRGESLRTPS